MMMKWYQKEPHKTFIIETAKELGYTETQVIEILDNFYNSILNNAGKIDIFKIPYIGKLFFKPAKRKKIIENINKKNDTW